jgi:hypothetical protein
MHYFSVVTNKVNEEENNAMDRYPLSVNILSPDDISEITYQSAAVRKNETMERLTQLIQKGLLRQVRTMNPSQKSSTLIGETIAAALSYPPRREGPFDYPKREEATRRFTYEPESHLLGEPARRSTEPPPHSSCCERKMSMEDNQSSSSHINTIIDLKLQIANQKEMIDRLASELNCARSKNKDLSKAKKPVSFIESLAKENARFDSSLLQQHYKLREVMTRIQKSMYKQQEKLNVLEESNRRLRKERKALQHQIDTLNCKLTESSSTFRFTSGPHQDEPHEPSGSQSFTASLTELSPQV